MSSSNDWQQRKPQTYLDRFALEYVRWRGLAPHDQRGAPWLDQGADEWVTCSPHPVFLALRFAWSNTKHWRPPT